MIGEFDVRSVGFRIDCGEIISFYHDSLRYQKICSGRLNIVSSHEIAKDIANRKCIEQVMFHHAMKKVFIVQTSALNKPPKAESEDLYGSPVLDRITTFSQSKASAPRIE